MWWVGGAIMALFAVRAVTGVLQRVILVQVAQLTSTRMQVDLLDHIMKLDSTWFQANPPGLLMERVQGDTLAVQNVWQVLIQGAGRDVIALLSLTVVAMTVDPLWTLTAVVGIPLLILPSLALQRYVRRKTGQMRDRSAQRSTRLDEIFHGIDAIKLNRMEDYQLSRFRKVTDAIVTAQIKTAAGRSTLPGLIDVMTGVGFFAVLVLGGAEIVSGEKTVGQFMSFFAAMALAFQPLRRLGATAGIFQVAAASLERLYALFDRRPTIVAPRAPVAMPRAATDIVLDDVHFSYGDGPVLRGTGFIARTGEVTALVGASGAGKTTVFRLLTRLADPLSGRIALGGTPLVDIAPGDLRDLFSVVTQDALLFDETIRENITLGRDVAPERLSAAVRDAHVAEFADTLPQGLDTLAGPRGSALSGGQRQRVAIARALLRDTPFLLLDEATSALDAASEAAVQSALDRLSAGRTTLVIAHRLATVRGADRIVVMDAGRVVEQGTHADLLANGASYAALYRLQFADGDDSRAG